MTKNLATGAQMRLAKASGLNNGYSFAALAFSGRRAIWTGISDVDEYGGVSWGHYTQSIGERRARRLEAVKYGDAFHTVDGDRSTLVYSWGWNFLANPDPCHQGTEPCRLEPSGGVARVIGQSRRAVAPAPAAALAASAGRVAIVPAEGVQEFEYQLEPTRRVETRRLADGALLATFELDGVPAAIGLDGATAAVLLTSDAGEKRIERYDAITGALLTASPVSASTTEALDVAGDTTVYTAGRTIWRLDAEGRESRVWTAKRPPISVSIEGRRVVWAVNDAYDRGSVFALMLGRGA